MNTPFLIGENIYLRPLDEQDLLGDYIQWFNDPEVCKYNSHHVFPYNKEKASEYIKNISLSKTDLVLAIALNKNNKHIGNVSLQKIDQLGRNAEFAILIGDRDSWGKGYAKEAARLVLSHGFLELNLHRIYCGTSADNVPMQRLAQSMGMSQEGQRRQAMFKHGQYQDIFEYGLLADEFISSKKE